MGSGFSCTGQVSACPGARSGANRLVTLREATPGLSEISWPADGQFRSAKPIYILPKTFILGSHNKVGRITLAQLPDPHHQLRQLRRPPQALITVRAIFRDPGLEQALNLPDSLQWRECRHGMIVVQTTPTMKRECPTRRERSRQSRNRSSSPGLTACCRPAASSRTELNADRMPVRSGKSPSAGSRYWRAYQAVFSAAGPWGR